MFSAISDNWAGQPLVSYETVLKFIRATKTTTGLRCVAYLDRTDDKIGLRVTAAAYALIRLKRHRIFPDWNYTICPHPMTGRP